MLFANVIRYFASIHLDIALYVYQGRIFRSILQLKYHCNRLELYSIPSNLIIEESHLQTFLHICKYLIFASDIAFLFVLVKISFTQQIIYYNKQLFDMVVRYSISDLKIFINSNLLTMSYTVSQMGKVIFFF